MIKFDSSVEKLLFAYSRPSLFFNWISLVSRCLFSIEVEIYKKKKKDQVVSFSLFSIRSSFFDQFELKISSLISAMESLRLIIFELII